MSNTVSDSNVNPIGVPPTTSVRVSSIMLNIPGKSSHNVLVISQFSGDYSGGTGGIVVAEIRLDGNLMINSQVNSLEGDAGTLVSLSGVLSLTPGTHQLDLNAFATNLQFLSAHHRSLSAVDLDACEVGTQLFSVANVKCFGAIGEEVHNRGSISANSNQLKLDAPAQGETPLHTWVEGAGIAIAAAGKHGQSALVTRIAKVVDDLNFVLAAPALHDAQDASITNDDSQPIQDAINPFGDTGGTVYFAAGTYICQGTVVLDNHSKIALVGPAARLGLEAGGATLIYARCSGSLITLDGSSNIFFQHLTFQYRNPKYDGDLVKCGTVNANTSFVVWERCLFVAPLGINGITRVTTARSLLNLNNTVSCTVRECGFNGAQTGIWGADGSYSNVICVQQCAFNNCDQWAILNPGESWAIKNCVFEPDSHGRPSGIGTDGLFFSYGLEISGCWFGDVGATAQITQVAVASNVLTITANNNFAVGVMVAFNSVATATFLNGQTVTILTVSATEFTANFRHADHGPTADTGNAVMTGTGKAWNVLFVLGASITGNRIAPAGGASDPAFILTAGSQGVFFGGNRIEGGIGIQYPANGYVFWSAVIGNDMGTTKPIANAGAVVPLTLLANTNLANDITYGLKLGSGEAGWSSDVLMNLGYISTLPQNLLVSAVAWIDGFTKDADDNQPFVHGSLGLIAPSAQPAAEVVVLAGQKGAHQKPATVARFGYSSGVPYMKGAVMAETLGTTVASQAAIVATGQIFHVSGVATVSTITPPFGSFTGRITIIPDDGFSWDTAGNIGKAGTAQVGLAVSFAYDGSKWWPTT